MTDSASDVPRPDAQLAAITDRLSMEFADVTSPAIVAEFVGAAFDRYAVTADALERTERFARERLVALSKADAVGDAVPAVLFLCIHNAGRSQMALGFFQALAGDQAIAWSGGSEPGTTYTATRS